MGNRKMANQCHTRDKISTECESEAKENEEVFLNRGENAKKVHAYHIILTRLTKALMLNETLSQN